MQQLRKATAEQAVRLIEELKQTPDDFFTPMAAVDEDENMNTPTGTSPSTVTTSVGNISTASGSRHSSGQSMTGLAHQEQEEASPFRDRASISTEPPILSPTPWQLWVDNSSTAVNPSPGGAFSSSDGRRQSFPSAAIQIPIPDLETTNAAINEYFIRIDQLFQPFSRDELKSLHRIASGLDDSTLNSAPMDRKRQQQIALSCLTAVASLGSQCLMDAQTDSRVQEQEAFTNIARHYLDVIIEHAPLDAVRVCALLAGTVIMNKPGLALSYVGVFSSPILPFVFSFSPPAFQSFSFLFFPFLLHPSFLPETPHVMEDQSQLQCNRSLDWKESTRLEQEEVVTRSSFTAGEIYGPSLPSESNTD